MAAPTPSGFATSSANSTSLTVTLPATVAVGDLLCVWIGVDGDVTSSISSAPTDSTSDAWTRLAAALSVTPSVPHTGAFYYKVADGDEDGGSLTVSWTGTQNTSAVSWVVDSDLAAPDAGTTVAPDSNNASSDPPTVTPAGGSDDYLYMVLIHSDQGDYSTSTQPSGYTFTTGTHDASTGTASGDSRVAVAFKQTTASTSDDPGTWTGLTSTRHAVNTLAFAPAGGGGSIPTIFEFAVG